MCEIATECREMMVWGNFLESLSARYTFFVGDVHLFTPPRQSAVGGGD